MWAPCDPVLDQRSSYAVPAAAVLSRRMEELLIAATPGSLLHTIMLDMMLFSEGPRTLAGSFSGA